ncbi:hypothetical protein [Acinetobacter sp. CFCC 10889]|uniref:hypothetical protein n=1 Tax=Acinetobacter sp. CFCC 10889 TaxID=1775557 RepID=UPI000DCF9F3E|nr:hypothetical protein [Acinetobacter sp. CFCC 10889]
MNKQLEIPAILQEIIGKKCCRKYLGEWNSLHLGFGEKIYHSNERLCTPFYGEWEIGTYFANWEIMQDGNIILDKKLKNTSMELQQQLDVINLCCITKIELCHTNTSVSFIFDHDIVLRFYERNELEMQDIIIAHAFLPNERYVEFHPLSGWKIEKLIKNN